jgi:hypothetical protein
MEEVQAGANRVISKALVVVSLLKEDFQADLLLQMRMKFSDKRLVAEILSQIFSVMMTTFLEAASKVLVVSAGNNRDKVTTTSNSKEEIPSEALE